MILGGRACHPELVEGSRAGACPPCFDKLSMTPIFKHIVILSDSEGSSSKSMATIQGEEDASYLSMTKGQIA
jgi:hypothetical protein